MGVISGLIKGQPNMPKFVGVDPQKEQLKSIAGNEKALPGAEQLAGGVNQFNMQQLEKMLQFAIPGYDNIKSGVSSAIQDQLAGKIPGDVSAAISRSGAERALSGGYSGSGMHSDLVARDLGLTSLGQIEKGISSSESWLKTMATIQQPGFFNVSSMFLTPEQTMAQDTEERNSKFQHDWSKNILKWQGSLGYLAGTELEQNSAQANSMIGSVVGSAAGGGGGGM